MIYPIDELETLMAWSEAFASIPTSPLMVQLATFDLRRGDEITITSQVRDIGPDRYCDTSMRLLCVEQ